MSESFDNVIGGGLALKGGLTLRKPAKRKKAHKKKEKKHKKSDKADKKRSKKDKKKDRRVHFESGELDDGAEAESTALTLIDEGSAAGDDDDTQIAETSSGGGGAGGGGEKAEAYDPLNDPNLTETQRKHLLAQRKRWVIGFSFFHLPSPWRGVCRFFPCSPWHFFLLLLEREGERFHSGSAWAFAAASRVSTNLDPAFGRRLTLVLSWCWIYFGAGIPTWRTER